MTDMTTAAMIGPTRKTPRPGFTPRRSPSVKLMVACLALVLAGCTGTTPGVRHVEEAYAAHPSAPSVDQALMRLADRMMSEGKYATAIPLYRRAYQHNGEAAALTGLGRAQLAVGANADALEAFTKAAQKDPQNVAAVQGLGQTWLALKNPQAAVAQFDAALALNPTDADSLAGKALALDALGNHDGAMSTYAQGLDSDPENLKLRNNMGLSMALAGEYDGAIETLKDVALAPEATAANRQNLALALSLAGQDELAGQVASIDLDSQTVNDNMAYFAELRALPAQSRMTAVLGAVRKPKHDLTRPANPAYGDDPNAKAAAQRLLAPRKVVVEVNEDGIEVPPLVDPTGYAVQIAAYRHASELIPGWRMLSEKYQDLIGGLDPRRSEVDFGPRGDYPNGFFYRLNAGPLTTYGEAASICAAIKERGGDCWVRPPTPTEGHLPDSQVSSPAPAPAPAGQTPQARKTPDADHPVSDALAPGKQNGAADSAKTTDGPEVAVQGNEEEVWVAVDDNTPQQGAREQDGAANNEMAPAADSNADNEETPDNAGND